jgi:CRP-like cAMP-binding protein
MGTKDVAAQLGQVSLFSGLSKRELAAVARETKEVSHPAGKVLAKEGDRGIGFFLITEGRAKVTVNGRARAGLGPGDFFGEISLLDQGPRSATVTAETDVRMLGLTAWAFQGLLRQHPTIAMKMLEVVAARLRATSRDLTTH